MAASMTRARYGTQTSPQWVFNLRFAILHLGALGIFFVPFDRSLVWLAVAMYVPRMFGVTAGYHRYFSHRTFKTSRAFQFVLALLATLSGQRGILWWGALHREHHRYSDQAGDVHSPGVGGFWRGHMGYLFEAKNSVTDLDRIPDFSRFPELRWLNKYYYIPVYGLLLGLYAAGGTGWLGAQITGWQAVIWGFFVSTVALLHVVLSVNSICHMQGRYGGTRRFATDDASVNHAWVALFTLGEGWHNNHHRYPAAARNGFAWWELDMTYLLLRMLEGLGVVRELRRVPNDVLEEGGLRPRRQRTFSR